MSERSRLGIEVDDGMWSEVLAVHMNTTSIMMLLLKVQSSKCALSRLSSFLVLVD